MLHRLREACAGELDKLQGMVEIDEAYFGGHASAKHLSRYVDEFTLASDSLMRG